MLVLTRLQLITCCGMAFNTLQVQNGFGRRMITLTNAEMSANAKWLIFAELFNFLDLFFIRTSVCLFVLRFLPKTQKWSTYFVYVAWILNFASTLDNMLSFGLQCKPFRGIWDHTIEAQCFDLKTLQSLFYGATVLGTLTDFIVVITPLTVLRNLQMSRAVKIGISIIMSLSFITAGLSIGKCIVTPGIRDPYFDSVPVQVLSLFEENLGIIFASVPALRQLYLSVNDRLNTNCSTKPADDPEAFSEKKLRRSCNPPTSPKSTHSSGIFGKSSHKSIIRHNFETHRKLHDIAGEQKQEPNTHVSTLVRAGSGMSHASTCTGQLTMTGCNVSPIADHKGRQDSLATLLPKSRAGSITGLRKEGQSAEAALPTPTLEQLKFPTDSIGPITIQIPQFPQADEKISPISPITQMSPITLSGRKNSMASSRRSPPASIASRPSTADGKITGARKPSLTSVRPRSRSVTDAVIPPPLPPPPMDLGHERKGSRNKLSLPFPIKTARSNDNLKDLKKKTQSLAINNNGSFYRPDTASSSRKSAPGIADVEFPVPPPPPIPQSATDHGRPLTDAINNITGVTRQAKSMQPPKRPPRSPLLSHPVSPKEPPQAESDGSSTNEKRATLGPEAAAKNAKYLSQMSSSSSIYPEREGKELPAPPLPPPPKHLTEAREGVKSLYF